MKRPVRVDSKELARELSLLGDESRDGLVQRWTHLYGIAPPPRTSRSLLMRAVAYKMQEQTYGGLPAPIRRMLVGDPESGSPRKVQPAHLTAKTLIQRIVLPLDWLAQRESLGFP
jgi:Protein of unknown function (DUF2924)